MAHPNRLLVLLVTAGLTSVARGQPDLLLPPFTGPISMAGHISSDGKFVACAGFAPGFPDTAFRWSVTTGLLGLGPSAGDPWAMSRNGQFITGRLNSGGIYVWSQNSGLVDLGTQPGMTDVTPRNISNAGDVIVGVCTIAGNGTGFVWRASTGMQAFQTTATDVHLVAVSTDGLTIAGDGVFADEPAPRKRRTFRWSASGGLVKLSNQPTNRDTWAVRGSPDLAMMVGAAVLAGEGISRGYLWREGAGFSYIPSPLGTTLDTHATSLSADGMLVGGWTEPHPGPWVATVWSPLFGSKTASDYLAEQGVAVPAGLQLQLVSDISADGQTLLIHACDPLGNCGPVLARLCYANCDASTSPPILNVNDFQCFLNRIAAGDSRANCDSSTSTPVLNIVDFQCFLNRFAAGCG